MKVTNEMSTMQFIVRYETWSVAVMQLTVEREKHELDGSTEYELQRTRQPIMSHLFPVLQQYNPGV